MNENNLGKPGKIYNFITKDYLFAALVLSIVGLMSLLGYTDKYNDEWSIILMIGSIIFFLYAIWFLTRWYSYRGSQFQIYELGLIYTDNKLNKTMIYWKDIEELKQKVIINYKRPGTFNNSFEYNMTTTDGLSLRIPRQVQDVVELAQSIDNFTFEQRLLNFKKIYEKGGKARFGELVIDKMGITFNNHNKSLFWGDVYTVETKYGKIIIYKNGELRAWKSIPISSLSNYSVLISFLKDKLGKKFTIITKWNEFRFMERPNIENPFIAPPIVKKREV